MKSVITSWTLFIFGVCFSSCLFAQSLLKVADIALPGATSRFDYQSIDLQHHRLYVTHMGANSILVFDTERHRLIKEIKGLPTATGILVIPALNRLFVSVAGQHQVAIFNTEKMQEISRVPAGRFPDGIAYAANVGKVYVSDEANGQETVIDASSGDAITTIALGGEVGNTQYNPISQRILANIQDKKVLVEIDPNTDSVVASHPLNCQSPHGLQLATSAEIAFVACEADDTLLVLDLNNFQERQRLTTGKWPDVIAFDEQLNRLYVASESGVLAIFTLEERQLKLLDKFKLATNAHSVSVNNDNHEVYFPLKNVGGRPALRVMSAVNN